VKYKYSEIALQTLNSAKEKSYAGYSKFDALNSPFLKTISFNDKWLRFIFTQIVKESPLNLRPLLGVTISRNPKGAALFAKAYLLLYDKTRCADYLKEAESLLTWLKNNISPNQKYLCWGYNYIWQNVPPFVQYENEPNLIVTVFSGEAFLFAYRLTGNEEYLKTARNIADFFISDLPVLFENENEKAIAYILNKQSNIVLNNQVLAGAYLVKVWRHTQEEILLQSSIKLLNFTINRRTNFNVWNYAYPAERFHGVDNYHTGGIIDGILEYYEETADDRYMEIYWKALDYYEKNLFEKNGAPRWMNNKKHPFDVHGSAQGIISFAKASKHNKKYIETAIKIGDWSIDNFYRMRRGDFIYRKGKLMNWNYSIMHWCNGWMTRALTEINNALK
jgi:rhamnogalacturonyl hydrolase YesR